MTRELHRVARLQQRRDGVSALARHDAVAAMHRKVVGAPGACAFVVRGVPRDIVAHVVLLVEGPAPVTVPVGFRV